MNNPGDVIEAMLLLSIIHLFVWATFNLMHGIVYQLVQNTKSVSNSFNNFNALPILS